MIKLYLWKQMIWFYCKIVIISKRTTAWAEAKALTTFNKMETYIKDIR